MRSFRFVLQAFAFFTLSCTSASAQDIPFFSVFPKISETRWYISNGWANGEHQSCEWRKELVSGQNGNLVLTLSNMHKGHVRRIGCAEIQSKRKYGYGRYEARMKASFGSGLNSAFFTYIGPPQGVPDHDEIDFEFLGKNPRLLQVGFWRKGKNYDMKVVDLGYDASTEFHTYRFDWHPDKIIWYVDDKEIHRTSAGSPIAKNEGKIFFSLWSGGKGMDDWLGPFKYTSKKSAEIERVSFTPFTPEQNDSK